jgi:hypothetical protein
MNTPRRGDSPFGGDEGNVRAGKSRGPHKAIFFFGTDAKGREYVGTSSNSATVIGDLATLGES